MSLALTKTADKMNVFPKDILTYKVDINNPVPIAPDQPVTETNITFIDLIPEGGTFIPNTFIINNVVQPGADPNVGVHIPDILSGTTTTVSYQVYVDDSPSVTQFTNIAQAIALSQPPGSESPQTYYSNPYTVNISVTDIFKSADKVNASLTEEIIYTIVVNNRGSVELINPIFKDAVPNCLLFVPGTFSIDGALAPNINPNDGIILSNIAPGQIINISFKVKVACILCPPKFVNNATLDYEIKINSEGETESNSITSNNSITITSLASFKQLSREEYVKIPIQKPDIEEILNTLVDIKITDTKVIKTPVGISLEGQKLTGHKLIVEGILNQKVEYISCAKEQSVHAAHFRVPFSSFIVLPENFVEGTSIQVEGMVEDIYTKLINKRTIFKNITFIIIAKIS
ncbi:SPOCS domain-containing protein [Clostridium sporogenes]|uniref:SPOCS domain-containing protein n=1 Tax=Clostridium sporogenes TaxID=1509 RepID=UPI003F8E3883